MCWAHVGLDCERGCRNKTQCGNLRSTCGVECAPGPRATKQFQPRLPNPRTNIVVTAWFCGHRSMARCDIACPSGACHIRIRSSVIAHRRQSPNIEFAKIVYANAEATGRVINEAWLRQLAPARDISVTLWGALLQLVVVNRVSKRSRNRT